MTSLGSNAKVKWDRPKDRLNPQRMDKDILRILELVVEMNKCFKGKVEAFVFVFVAARREEIQRFVQIERVGLKKMTHHKFIDVLFIQCVQVLKLMQGLESLNV